MSWFALYTLLEWSIRLAMVPVILRRRFPTSTALAWLSTIFFLPELGLVLYLLVGGSRFVRRRLRRYRELTALIRPEAVDQSDHVTWPDLGPAQRPVILQAQRIGGMPILAGNNLELLDQTQFLARLVADIDAATDSVHLLYYIFEPDQCGEMVAQALVRAAGRSVACRLLIDAAGSYRLLKNHSLLKQMQAAGVQVMPALPVAPWGRRLARLDLRNHRKLAVIDGRIAHTGSQNVVDMGPSRRQPYCVIDINGRFTGPIVSELQLVFLEDWAFETRQELEGQALLPRQEKTGQVIAQAVPSGPNKDTRSLPRVLLAAINGAQWKIIISSPYLIPDEPTILALSMAVERGVETHMIVPEESDHPLVSAAARSHFDLLLENGVHIHLYQKGVLHAKTMTVDDDLALLGSSNLDIRSFYLNFEINVLMYGPEVTHQLRHLQMTYMADSRQLDPLAWSRRPRLTRLAQSAAALFSPLL